MDREPAQALSMDKRVLFLRVCLWIGAVADLLATLPLLFPEMARRMFGLQAAASGKDYLYVSRIGASLMLGWTFLLVWASQKPVERKGIILLTVAPVLAGLLGSSVLAVQSGFMRPASMLPLWIFYALIIPLYVMAYVVAVGIEKNRYKKSAMKPKPDSLITGGFSRNQTLPQRHKVHKGFSLCSLCLCGVKNFRSHDSFSR